MRFSEDGRLLVRIELPADLAPADLAVDEAGAIYLAESFGGAVVKLGADGGELARFGDPAAPQRFAAGAIDLDARGNIYLATYASGVVKLAPSGQAVASALTSAPPLREPAPQHLGDLLRLAVDQVADLALHVELVLVLRAGAQGPLDPVELHRLGGGDDRVGRDRQRERVPGDGGPAGAAAHEG